MSSLTKLLITDRKRGQIADTGRPKNPMLLVFNLPAELEEAVISLRSGDPHVVRVVPQRTTRAGFFPLPLEGEDSYHADLVSFLFDFGKQHDWGGVADVDSPTPEVLEGIADYFESYGSACHQIFVGIIGFAALFSEGLLTLPETDVDVDAITSEVLTEWMEEHMHVGKVQSIPVFFNPHLAEFLLFADQPDHVGQLTRMGDNAALLLHNAERGLVILRVTLETTDELPDENTTELPAEHASPDGDDLP